MNVAVVKESKGKSVAAAAATATATALCRYISAFIVHLLWNLVTERRCIPELNERRCIPESCSFIVLTLRPGSVLHCTGGEQILLIGCAMEDSNLLTGIEFCVLVNCVIRNSCVM